MSKRYTFTTPYKDAYEIVDRDIDKAMKPEDVADLLNRQDKRIAELEEQLKNAIVPKFKIGQEVYYYHIARNKTYSGYVEDTQWFATKNGIYYRISQLQRDYFWIREDEVFATKEEAQAKLEELKGE